MLIKEMHDNERRLAALRDRIRDSEHISPDDRKNLLEFADELRFRSSEYSDERQVKLLQHCVLLAGDSRKYDPDELPDVSLTDALEDSEAAKELVRWIHRNYDNEETNRDYRVAIRMFAEHVTEGTGKPQSIEQISATTSQNHDPMPDPSKMLWWDEHVLPMIEASRNLRDKALIAVAWDSGARSGEITELRVGDVTDHKYGLSITVDGKRGQRSVTLIPSVPYLRQWLNVHPAGDDPSAPLWSKLDTAEDPSYEMKLKILRKAARKAGITHTDVTFTRMRKSSASYLASQNVNQAHLEDRYGWKRGSDLPSRYITVFGDANDRAVARAHGMDVEADEPDPIGPITCPRCNRESPREKDRCIWCGQALEHSAVESVKEDQQELRESVLKLAKENPDLLDDFQKARELFDLFDGDPELLEDAREFTQALSGD